MADGAGLVDPRGDLRRPPNKPRASGYSQEELNAAVQEALRSQANQYAFSDLKRQVDRLAEAVGKIEAAATQIVAETAKLNRRLDEHTAEPMHVGMREILEELGLTGMSDEERKLLPEVLRAANLRKEREIQAGAFWSSWQAKTSAMFTSASFFLAALGFLLHLAGVIK